MIKKYNMKIHTLKLLVISIVLFTIYFLTKKYSPDNALIVYKIGMLIYGLFILLDLSLFENTFYGVTLLMNVFLIDEMGFTNYDNMFLLINVFLFTILGFIINLIRFKPKLKLHHYTKTTLIFGLGIALAGLGVRQYDPNFEVVFYWFMPFLVGFLILMAVILLNYFSSSTKSNLEDLCLYFSNVVLLILFEILLTMFTFEGGPSQFLLGKNLYLGIGSPNTVAIILQMALPFMLFFSIKKRSLALTLIYFINIFLILLTLSRGAIVVTIPLIILYAIYLFYYNHDKKIIYNYLTVAFSFIGLILIISLIFSSFIMNFLDSLFNNTISSLNGRLPLYNYVKDHYSTNPLFGIGIVSNCIWNIEPIQPAFLFAHSSFLQMLWMGGVVLLLCFIIHLVDKYYYLLGDKKYGLLMFAFFIIPGAYGTFDVTYFNIHYTLYLLIAMYLYKSNNNYNCNDCYNLLYKTP